MAKGRARYRPGTSAGDERSGGVRRRAPVEDEDDVWLRGKNQRRCQPGARGDGEERGAKRGRNGSLVSPKMTSTRQHEAYRERMPQINMTCYI